MFATDKDGPHHGGTEDTEKIVSWPRIDADTSKGKINPRESAEIRGEAEGAHMKIKGRAWKFGDDVNTDEIIQARYLNTIDPAELAAHCMEDVDREFAGKVGKGDLIVAGKNFGCGSSREHAPIAIKAAGVGAVIAASFARIFYRNAFNIGLPIFESPGASRAVAAGDEMEIDGGSGEIRNLSRKESYRAAAIPPFMEELVRAGGLMAYVKEKLHRR